jgi:hypothetical protein
MKERCGLRIFGSFRMAAFVDLIGPRRSLDAYPNPGLYPVAEDRVDDPMSIMSQDELSSKFSLFHSNLLLPSVVFVNNPRFGFNGAMDDQRMSWGK